MASGRISNSTYGVRGYMRAYRRQQKDKAMRTSERNGPAKPERTGCQPFARHLACASVSEKITM